MRRALVIGGALLGIAALAFATTHFEGPVDSKLGFTVDGVPLAGGPAGPPGPPGPPADGSLPPHTWIVQAGPHSCAGGANSGLACVVDGDCPSSTCTGTGTLTFRDVIVGTNVSNIVEGDLVEWDYTTGTHDLLGGQVCSGGSNDAGACDPDSGDFNCHVCTGGSNNGTQCTSDGNCTGGGTCDLTGTCTTTLAETWDGGTHAAPYSFSHPFLVPGDYPYICSLHAATGMKGLVHVDIGSVVIGPHAYPAQFGLSRSVVIGPYAMQNSPGPEDGMVAIGAQALQNFASDTHNNVNTAVGNRAMKAATTADANTSIGAATLLSCTTCGANVAVGDGAGVGTVIGGGNTFVGHNAGPQTGQDPLTTVAIGSGATVDADGCIAVGANAECTAGDVVQLGAPGNYTGLKVGSRKALLCDLVGIPTCGTGCASLTGSSPGNCVGAVTTSSSATSVTVNWSGTRSAAPFCTCTTNSTASFCAVTSVTTGHVVFGLSAGLTGTINYHCFLGA